MCVFLHVVFEPFGYGWRVKMGGKLCVASGYIYQKENPKNNKALHFLSLFISVSFSIY